MRSCMSAEPVHIVLVLDPEADPIGGSVRGDRSPARQFSGWLALGRALEQELAVARRGSATAPVGQVEADFGDDHRGVTG
jgi:hypothetical protein